MSIPIIADHGSITPQECRELLGLGDSQTARVEVSRYFKKWSEDKGFLRMEGKPPRNRYMLYTHINNHINFWILGMTS